MTRATRLSLAAATAVTVVAAGAFAANMPGTAPAGEGEGPPPTVAAEIYAERAALADVSLAEPLVGVGSEAAWACASCHGAEGEGNGDIPRLAGLPAGYIVKQLMDYRSGARVNDNMQYVTATLSDEEMYALGLYYSRLDTPNRAEPALGGDIDRGRQLALEGDWRVGVPACFVCHGSSGWGVEEAFPPLAAQQAAYTYGQLAAWVDGRRQNSALRLMHDISLALSDEDMRAVADYLATRPAPPPRPPQMASR
jgi:cytochrome c553